MHLSLPPRPSWHARAACSGVGPSVFYPDRGVQPAEVDRARAICASCPVQDACEEAGLHEVHGIWRGLVPSERRELRKISA